MTKFGVVLPQHEAGREELLSAANLAEERGVDSIWVSDVLTGRGNPQRSVLEGWSALAAAAATTKGVVCGTLVLRVGMRPPQLVARMFQSLALIAPGRVVAGLGIGDSIGRSEQLAYGIPFRKRKARLKMLEETIDALRTHAPEVPIWLGGSSREILELAPTVDGWNFWGPVEKFQQIGSRLPSREGFEKSWAGSLPAEAKMQELISAGIDHIIVAVGATNFRERIEQVCAVRNGSG